MSPVAEIQFDRRNSDTAVLILVQQVHDDVQAMKKRLDEHMKDETLELAEAVATLMVKAFPEGDPLGHRVKHEADIQAAKDRAEFWKKLLFEISKWGIAGVLGWLAYAAWTAFLLGPRK
jgi:hypothetical protein